MSVCLYHHCGQTWQWISWHDHSLGLNLKHWHKFLNIVTMRMKKRQKLYFGQTNP